MTTTRTTGPKYVRGRDVADIAREVRGEIKAAIKAGDLPAGLAVSVRISRHSMCRGIDARVTAAPAGTDPDAVIAALESILEAHRDTTREVWGDGCWTNFYPSASWDVPV